MLNLWNVFVHKTVKPFFEETHRLQELQQISGPGYKYNPHHKYNVQMKQNENTKNLPNILHYRCQYCNCYSLLVIHAQIDKYYEFFIDEILYQSVKFKSVLSGAGTSNSSEAHEVTPGFQWDTFSSKLSFLSNVLQIVVWPFILFELLCSLYFFYLRTPCYL